MKLVSRAEWGARPARRRAKAEMNAVTTHHWEGPTIKIAGQLTWDHSKCAGIVRGIQNFHMDGRGWSDIAYNFLACPHGYTFEGRGLNVINAANGTTVGNRTSHTVCSLAGVDNPFPMEERIGVKDTVAWIAINAPAKYKAIPHSDWHATDCCGNVRRTWDRAGMPVNDTPAPNPPPIGDPNAVLKLGSKGTGVEWVQRILHDKTGGELAVDGDFGPATEARVKDFQRVYGLKEDGIVGPITHDALEHLSTVPAPWGRTPWTMPKPTIGPGDSNPHVGYLQQVLTQKAGLPLGDDMKFGPKTKLAVEQFQQKHGLTVDGVVGPKTWELVDRVAVM